MRNVASVIGMLLLASGTLHARLPAPTPEQQAAAEQKKAEEAQKAKEQQDALTRVQDRLAAKFGRNGRTAAGPTEQDKLPQKAIEARGDAGPNGGREQSAEAHSTQQSR